MKCLCGYEYEPKLTVKDPDYSKHNPDNFIPLQMIERAGYHYKHAQNIFYIFACPKCGTLKIALEDE